MNSKPISKTDNVDAQRCHERVGPKVVCQPEVSGNRTQSPVLRAHIGGQVRASMASMGASIEELARESLSKRLEDYKLEAVLGKGAFGSVYQAKDLSARGQGKRVAIKQIPRAKVEGEYRDLVFLEKDILSHLTATDSPYFTHLIESFSDPINFTMVLGLAPRGNLREAMYNSKSLLRMHEVQFVMAQLCHAVGVMHDSNVIHRDIKPENILLDKHGRLVIGDFGLGHMFRPTSGIGLGLEVMGSDEFWHRTSGECGTPGYMAPEMLRNERYSYSVDNFSIGVIFYELVFGTHPFRGRDRKDMEDRMLYDSPYFPDWFTKDCYPAYLLMRRLLAKNPQYRVSMKDAKDSIFFKDINWSQIANKTQSVPEGWNPPAPEIELNANLSKRVLIDDPYQLQRWRPQVGDWAFTSAVHFKIMNWTREVEQPPRMRAPADSIDMRKERHAAGLYEDEDYNQPAIVNRPANEATSSTAAVRDESETASRSTLSDASSGRRRSPYDSTRIGDPHKGDESMEIVLNYASEPQGLVPPPAPKLRPAVLPKLQFPVTKVDIGRFPVPPAKEDRVQGKTGKDHSGLSLFNVSIVAVEEYVPGEEETRPEPPRDYPVFYIQAAPGSPKIKKESVPVNLSDIPFKLTTYATNSTLVSSPSPLTPMIEESRVKRSGKLLDVDALWHALERQEIHPLPQVKQEKPSPRIPARLMAPPTRPLRTPPAFLNPTFNKVHGPFAAFHKLAEIYGVPME